MDKEMVTALFPGIRLPRAGNLDSDEWGCGAGKASRPGAKGSGSGHALGGQQDNTICSAAFVIEWDFQPMPKEAPQPRLREGTGPSLSEFCPTCRGRVSRPELLGE